MKTIKELEAMFAEDVASVLEYVAPVIKEVEVVGETLRKGNISDPLKVNELLQTTTGLFAFLHPVAAIAKTERLCRGEMAYADLRATTEAEGKKFVATVATQEANLSVQDYRRVRNILDSYVEICNKIIMSTQSALKDITAHYVRLRIKYLNEAYKKEMKRKK